MAKKSKNSEDAAEAKARAHEEKEAAAEAARAEAAAEAKAKEHARHQKAGEEYDPKKKYVVAPRCALSCGSRGIRKEGDPVELADLAGDEESWTLHVKNGIVVELKEA